MAALALHDMWQCICGAWCLARQLCLIATGKLMAHVHCSATSHMEQAAQ